MSNVRYAYPIPSPYNGHHDACWRYTLATEGPAFLRSATRIHRVRALRHRVDSDGVVTELWCGSHRYDLPIQTIDRHDPVCGTCEGRAIGAGQPSTLQLLTEPSATAHLLFKPRQPDPPRWCPGSGTMLGDPERHLCYVCGEHVSYRGLGSPYRPSYGMVRHEPAVLVAPCNWHAWKSLVLKGQRAVCICTTQRVAA